MKKIGFTILVLALCLMLFSCKASTAKGSTYTLTELKVTYSAEASADDKSAIDAQIAKAQGSVTLKFNEDNTFELVFGSSTKRGTFIETKEKITLMDESGVNLMVGKKSGNKISFDQPAASLGLVGQIAKLTATYELNK